MARPVIAVTTGEPAGIGPEISIRGAWACRGEVLSVLIGDYSLLKRLAADIDTSIRLTRLDGNVSHHLVDKIKANTIGVIDSPLDVPVIPGKLDARNGRSVLTMLDVAIEGALNGRFDAVVTGPVQKSTINDAGFPFTGHTEYFADKTGSRRVVMMLSGMVNRQAGRSPVRLSVALATTHLPLKAVAAAITVDSLAEILFILNDELKSKFGIASPRILLTGLNPHAGENGYLGDEEINVITPVIEKARESGIRASGPFPADTLFQPHYLDQADCFLAMYHDQGLPVLKYATFGHGVNITLGLPMIRTSVDHGTALDIASAGIGSASYSSMTEAIRIAAEMAVHRKHHQRPGK